MVSLGKMPVEDLIRIAHAGGSFRLDTAHRYPDELIQIATAANTVRIATAGKGSVIFED